MKLILNLFLVLVITIFLTAIGFSTLAAADSHPAKKRLLKDIQSGRPIVIYVIVALADNRYQQIVPVPAKIGNGQIPAQNLYWGALYGVKTYFRKKPSWKSIVLKPKAKSHNTESVLERIAFYRSIKTGNRTARVYLIAEAWDGKQIYPAINTFYKTLSGARTVQFEVTHAGKSVLLNAGSQAHLVVYVGHNGLMDITFAKKPAPGKLRDNRHYKSAMVLACKSKPYFKAAIEKFNSHPVLLTTGLMAPEAYTLEAAINAWVKGSTSAQIRKAAGNAYSRYQKIKPSAGQRLFYSKP